MGRYFNTEGQCDPDIHYMVRLDDRLSRIKQLFVDRGKYFIINRGRQYGKTTTLMELEKYLKKDYIVLFIDFQKMSAANFENEGKFAVSFTKYFVNAMKDGANGIEEAALQELIRLAAVGQFNMNEMFGQFSKICAASKKPIVMMIDEVDSAANHQVFLDFLALLRGYYLKRKDDPTFHSVILAGVYDIKNLKLKMRPEEEHKYNSPWNTREANEENESLLAFDECSRNHRECIPYDSTARFNIDMSFSIEQIALMLQEYEADKKTGMEVCAIAKCIYEYTSGYPYLVSAICKFLDEEILGSKGFENMAVVWTKEGIAEAVKILLKENTPLFDSMAKQLEAFKNLRNIIEEILYRGKQIPFSPYVESVNLGVMFGFLKEENGHIAVANRIFEMGLLNMFMAEEAISSDAFQHGQRDKNQFTKGARLNMDLVLEKFVVYFTDIYGDNEQKFVEEYGRKFFLLYLKPIINGTGNYYVEAQTRDAGRTDVIVDYLGEQFIVELKIWRGNEYNERGEEQLAGYLDYFHQKKGYMLSFNFNKKKEIGMKTIKLGGKTIVEAVV